MYRIIKETNYIEIHFYQKTVEAKGPRLRTPGSKMSKSTVKKLLKWIRRGVDDFKKNLGFLGSSLR